MRNRRQTDVSEALKHYLLTGERNSGLDGGSELKWLFFCDKGKLSELWGIHRDVLLTEWIKNNPCSRPWYWWVEEAPKEPVHGYEGQDFTHRQRIGGKGTPDYEVLAYGPCFDRGIPSGWISEFDEAYYNGRALDVHGQVIATNYKEGDFSGVAIDPNDPPTFESEAAYLSRHGLLTKEEKAYLKKHPELLEPEAVVFDECDVEETEPAACTPQ